MHTYPCVYTCFIKYELPVVDIPSDRAASFRASTASILSFCHFENWLHCVRAIFLFTVVRVTRNMRCKKAAEAVQTHLSISGRIASRTTQVTKATSSLLTLRKMFLWITSHCCDFLWLELVGETFSFFFFFFFVKLRMRTVVAKSQLLAEQVWCPMYCTHRPNNVWWDFAQETPL